MEKLRAGYGLKHNNNPLIGQVYTTASRIHAGSASYNSPLMNVKFCDQNNRDVKVCTFNRVYELIRSTIVYSGDDKQTRDDLIAVLNSLN